MINSTPTPHPTHRFFSLLAGFLGISMIIIIHELGHFFVALACHVPVSHFSLGLGPVLWHVTLGNTIFQISALPLGGYVTIEPHILAQQTYTVKILITLAGIFFNFVFCGMIMMYYSLGNKEHTIQSSLQYLCNHDKQNRKIIGPIGLIQLIGVSLAHSKDTFMIILGIISLNIGLFNLLPLPFLDGGSALFFTIQALKKYASCSAIIFSFYTICMIGCFFMYTVFTAQCTKK